jgi:2-dehydropantoate 2-reductase
VGSKLEPYDYVILTTKNVPDIDSNFPSTIAQAVTKETSIVLLQNGLNIERPFQHCFTSNAILSGISLISATETSPGNILHDDPDRLIVGSFTRGVGLEAVGRFTTLYAASGKVHCEHAPDVRKSRWEKLVYNASYNSACALVGLDTARMRLLGFPIDYVIRPLMEEIVKIAHADGVMLDATLIQRMINVDRMDTYFKPSMLQDVEKVRFRCS